MTFSSFFEQFPELINSEFRNIFILDNEIYKHIPPGNYAFLELFCQDVNCDCRNVVISVITDDPHKVWAVLRYGWESKKFYREWFGGDNELAQNMPGAFIDSLMSPYNLASKEFLALFNQLIKDDQKYAKRIEAHYRMFKEKIDSPKKKSLIQNVTRDSSGKKVGRNDLCPCDSGRKFKKCCFLGENS